MGVQCFPSYQPPHPFLQKTAKNNVHYRFPRQNTKPPYLLFDRGCFYFSIVTLIINEKNTQYGTWILLSRGRHVLLMVPVQNVPRRSLLSGQTHSAGPIRALLPQRHLSTQFRQKLLFDLPFGLRLSQHLHELGHKMFCWYLQ